MLPRFCGSAMGTESEECPDIPLEFEEGASQARGTRGNQQLCRPDIGVLPEGCPERFPTPPAHPVPFNRGFIKLCGSDGSGIDGRMIEPGRRMPRMALRPADIHLPAAPEIPVADETITDFTATES